MKLKLTYQPEEQEQADLILRFARDLLPEVKIRRDKSKEPRLCVYVTTKGPKSVGAVRKTLDPSPRMWYNNPKE